ncbi:MAG: 50S ribosomal protein L17 [Planctomycetota bacterium]|nr:MAG: 50S ribosomal protein L17 [Planctomycetota bacterium]
MRHKQKGRVLGRSPSHRKALFRNLASALILTERPDADLYPNPPKVPGRIVTTLAKAKEVRPMVEKCVTIARKARAAELASQEFATEAEPNTEAWQQWRNSEQHAKWVAARAPAVAARRRLLQILRNREAVSILVDVIAERFEDRPGGYTRILRLATPRLGDAGTRAVLEFVGKHDRVIERSERPSFGDEPEEDQQPQEQRDEGSADEEQVAADSSQPVAESPEPDGDDQARKED